MPFARGYSDNLRDCGISMEEFLEFIDNYNIVSGGSPPFQILDRKYLTRYSRATMASADTAMNHMLIGHCG